MEVHCGKCGGLFASAAEFSSHSCTVPETDPATVRMRRVLGQNRPVPPSREPLPRTRRPRTRADA